MNNTQNQVADDEVDQTPQDTKQAPASAQNPDAPQAEGGKHSPEQAGGGASDSDPGRG